MKYYLVFHNLNGQHFKNCLITKYKEIKLLLITINFVWNVLQQSVIKSKYEPIKGI